jgi:hypothetical protein
MVFLLSIGIPILYLMGAGVTFWFYEDVSYDNFLPGLYAFFWPLLFIPVLAYVAIDNLSEYEYVPRAQRKAAKEIAKAKHEQEIARIQAETIRIKELEAGLK